MKIQDIMTRDVRTCGLETSLTEVARQMRAACCGMKRGCRPIYGWPPSRTAWTRMSLWHTVKKNGRA